MIYFAAALFAYLLGSIPFGFLAGLIAGVDVRQHGSGNIGATNTLRVLGKKYGYTPEIGKRATARIASGITALAERLQEQKARGSRFFIGDILSAMDVYWAAFSNAMKPLDPELCPMHDRIRQSFTITEPTIVAATHPILIEHRDFIFKNYLELPVDLS